MDISSLLSPSEAPRASSLDPVVSSHQSNPSPLRRTPSSSNSKSAANASPRTRTIHPPSSIPAHIRSPARASVHNSPLISPVPTNGLGAPHFARTNSSQGMDALADLAALQSHQPIRSTPPLLNSRPSYEASRSSGLHRPQLTSHPRASFDISMVETPRQLPRGDFSGTSLPHETQQRLTELVKHVQETPSAYESHIEMIKILHQGFVDHIYPSSDPSARRDPRAYDLLAELRQARENMDRLFAVGEEQWMDWLQDESIIAQTAEERVSVIELCRRANEEEFGSSKLWLTYADWATHCYKWANEEPSNNSADNDPDPERLIGKELFKWDSTLQVWNEGLDKTKHDMASSHLVWDRYMQTRFPDLHQNMSEDLTDQAMQLFQERLLTPHGNWDQTFQAFSGFVSANFSDVDYERIMATLSREAAPIKAVWSARDEFEGAISEAVRTGDKYLEYQLYLDYIQWERLESEKPKTTKARGKKRDKPSKPVHDIDLVRALYQRAILRNPSVASLWEANVEYVIPKLEIAPLEVLFRATKHCPWSGSLWKQYILLSELSDAPYHETENIKHEATKTGMLEAAGIEDVLKIHDAWCGYLLRRTRKPEASEEDADVAEMGMRTSMEAVQSIASKLSLPIDFDPYFRIQRKYIEYLKSQGRLDNARKQFDDAITTYGKHYRFWLQFYNFEMQKSIHMSSLQQNARDGVALNLSAPFAVAILKQGLTQPDLDYPEYLVEALLNHCEDYEDAEDLQSTLTFVSKVQRDLAMKRQRETEQTAAQLVQQQNESTSIEMTDETQTGKRKRDENAEDEDESNKRVRSNDIIQNSIEPVQSAEEQLKRDREHASILVQNLPHAITETRVRQYFSNCGTVSSLKAVQDEDNSFIVEFRDSEEAKYALSRDGQEFDGAILSVTLNTGSTLYVTNYPAIADEAYLRSLLDHYGEIINVRFPSLQGNKRRRFCYIEFKSANQAQAALELNNQEVEGLNLVVKISNPAVRQERTQHKGDDRTIFVGQLPFKATEDEVTSEFSQFGEIEVFRMPHDSSSKQRNKGIAFITFKDALSASAAISMNGRRFQDRNIKVEITSADDQARSKQTRPSVHSMSPSPYMNGVAGASPQTVSSAKLSTEEIEERRQRTIALSNVPDTVNETRIRVVAEKIGKVRKVILKTNHQGALVEFESQADAGKAALELDGHEIDPGRKLHVTTEKEMMQQQPEKKTTRLGGVGGSASVARPGPASSTPTLAKPNLVKRPAQPGVRRGGNLGQRTGILAPSAAGSGQLKVTTAVQRQNGGDGGDTSMVDGVDPKPSVTATATEPTKVAAKNNDDFRAMLSKSN